MTETKEVSVSNSEEPEFATAMIGFFDASIRNGATPIRLLADIQENFPKHYEVMLKIKDDPSLITDNDSVPERVKSTMLLIVLKASKLGMESQRVYEMSIKEKREFANKLDEFSKFIKRKLEEEMKIEKEMKKEALE